MTFFRLYASMSDLPLFKHPYELRVSFCSLADGCKCPCQVCQPWDPVDRSHKAPKSIGCLGHSSMLEAPFLAHLAKRLLSRNQISIRLLYAVRGLH